MPITNLTLIPYLIWANKKLVFNRYTRALTSRGLHKRSTHNYRSYAVVLRDIHELQRNQRVMFSKQHSVQVSSMDHHHQYCPNRFSFLTIMSEHTHYYL